MRFMKECPFRAALYRCGTQDSVDLKQIRRRDSRSSNREPREEKIASIPRQEKSHEMEKQSQSHPFITLSYHSSSFHALFDSSWTMPLNLTVPSSLPEPIA